MKEFFPNYEQAALIFYHEKMFRAAIHFFLECVRISPKNSMTWYGLGDSVCAHALEQNSREQYEMGISLVKKSALLDRNNEYSFSMLTRMMQNPNIGKKKVEEIKAFPDTGLEFLKASFELSGQGLKKFFQSASYENRVRLAILLGDVGDSSIFETFNEAVINDEQQHVRLAIMKRLAMYAGRPRLKETFEYLVKENRSADYEPYFSFTLRAIAGYLREKNLPDWAGQILLNLNKA